MCEALKQVPIFLCSSKSLKPSLQRSENRLRELKRENRGRSYDKCSIVSFCLETLCYSTSQHVCHGPRVSFLSRKSLPFRGLGPPRRKGKHLGIYGHLRQACWIAFSLLLLRIEFVFIKGSQDRRSGHPSWRRCPFQEFLRTHLCNSSFCLHTTSESKEQLLNFFSPLCVSNKNSWFTWKPL